VTGIKCTREQAKIRAAIFHQHRSSLFPRNYSKIERDKEREREREREREKRLYCVWRGEEEEESGNHAELTGGGLARFAN